MNGPEAANKRTTLAALDKEVCARRGRRAPAKAAARSRSRSTGLGEEVLTQIDLLRGKSKSSRRRGLLALAYPTAPTTKPSLVSARAYDLGAPIRVSNAYSGAFSASLRGESGSWPSAATQDDGSESITAFSVEVFEEERTSNQPRPRARSAPAQAPIGEPSAPAAVIAEVPVATALGRGLEEDGMLGLDLSAALTKDDADDADQFERQIQAILAGKTTRPAQQSAAMAGPPDRTAVAPQAADSAPRPHDIFEQMGRNMAYATAFNLPAMELGKRFDEIEREIVREEVDAGQKPQAALSLELTDDDINASLGLPIDSTTSSTGSTERASPSDCQAPAPPPTKTELVAEQPSAAPARAPVEAPPPTDLPADGVAPQVAPPPAPIVTVVHATQPADTGRPPP